MIYYTSLTFKRGKFKNGRTPMYRWKFGFRVEVVTPLVMSGADRADCEMRPPSIKGDLRFWFRAMMGGILGDTSDGKLEKLRYLEGNLFGSSSAERASGIKISVKDFSKAEQRYFDSTNIRDFPIRYLGYGLGDPKPGRKYLTPGQSCFTVEIEAINKSASELSLGTMWLLCNLGGLGARTRRGFGSVKITDVSITVDAKAVPIFPEFEQLFATINEKQQLSSYLSNGIKQIAGLYCRTAGISQPAQFTHIPKFTVIAPQYLDLRIVSEKNKSEIRCFDSWNRALSFMGESYKYVRTMPQANKTGRVTRDYNVIREHSGKNNVELTLPVLGLPLPYKLGKNRERDIVIAGATHTRRASPLMFRVFKLAANSYALLMLGFKAEFLPENENLCITERNTKTPAMLPTGHEWEVIDKFMDENGIKVPL